MELNSENSEPPTANEPCKSAEKGSIYTGSGANVKRKRGNESDDDDLSNSKSAEEKMTAEQSVFSNDYLLWTILKDSGFKDLKIFRQVNRLFHLEAMKLLKTRGVKSLQIKDLVFTTDSEARLYKVELEPLRTLSFEQCSQFVSNSFKLPFYGLHLKDPIEQLYLMEDSRSFFQAHGSHFEELEITFSTAVDAGLFTVQLYFGKHFPNLKCLTINSLISDSFSPLNPPNTTFLKMKKLKILKFRGDISRTVTETILQMSPNLERIYWDIGDSFCSQCYFLKTLVDCNAVSLLKEVRLTFCSDSLRMCVYEEMLEKKFEFEHITGIDFMGPFSSLEVTRIADVLTKLLNRCSQTVTKFSNIYPLGQVTGLVVPVFPHVTSAEFCFYNSSLSSVQEPSPLLPPGTNFSIIFPNLRKLNLHFDNYQQMMLETIFSAPRIPLLTVKTLYVTTDRYDPSGYMPTSWVKQFCEMFPDVTNASFPTLYETVLEHVWKLECLERLKFDLGVNVEEESYPKVDSAFTGFSEETVRQLYSTDFRMSDTGVRALSVKPSIADLKQLKSLSVQLADQEVVDYDENYSFKKYYENVIFTTPGMNNLLSVNGNVIFSHVAKRFLIEMCPQHKRFTFYFDDEDFSL